MTLDRPQRAVVQKIEGLQSEPLHPGTEFGPSVADMLCYRRGGWQSLSAPLVMRGAVCLGGLDGRLVAVDRGTGRKLGTLDLGAPVVAMAPLSEGALLLATYPRTLVRVETNLG